MKVLLVGAGGYGQLYLKLLLENTDSQIEFEGIVEKYFDSCPMKEDIVSSGIPVYESMQDFFAEHSADLSVICTPPFLHREQSIYAVMQGSNVLCEKPAAPTVKEVEAMIEAEKKYGKFIAVGYQWSFSEAIQELKKDIIGGRLGKALSFKTIISWPRDYAYYSRGGGWAGRISRDGSLILDSIASNACAHYIHNMFFILGEDMNTSAVPHSVEAECLRANNIENFDTCILRMKMQGGAELFFAASHSAKEGLSPEFIYEFENATVSFCADEGSEIIADFGNGQKKNYGDPFADIMKKFWDCVECVKSGETPICTAKTAIAHTKLIQSIYNNAEISDFPDEIKVVGEKRIYIQGLYENICKAYENKSMLSEIGCDYAEKYDFLCIK